MSPTSCRCSTPRRRVRARRKEERGAGGGARREGRASQAVARPVLRQRWRGARPGSGWDRVDRRRVRSRPAPPHAPRTEGPGLRTVRESFPPHASVRGTQHFSHSSSASSSNRVTPTHGDVGHPHAMPYIVRGKTALAHAHRSAPTVARCPRAAAQPGGLPGGFPAHGRRDPSSPGGVPT
jgi:hypothetical protein